MERCNLKIEKISTTNNLADFFTKLLNFNDHHKFTSNFLCSEIYVDEDEKPYSYANEWMFSQDRSGCFQ